MKALAFAALVAASPATAQMQCGGYADAVAHLSTAYGESIVVRGIDGAGAVVEMFANPDTGTWTALMVYPNGTTCMVAAGGDFEYHKPKPNA